MPVAGIIAEYNPFHNGHLYQIQEVKKKFPDAPLVVAMSGNFLQRGEPASFDKWTRAEQALANGTDLVVEMPVLACVQPADRFAFNGVSILASLGVTDLFFGAEHAEYDFADYARLVQSAHGDFKTYSESYAATFQKAVAAKIGHNVDQPNDLLGLAYAKANLKLGEPLRLNPIQRKNANYHEVELKAGTIASATAIRQHYLAGNLAKLSAYVPEATLATLKTQRLLTWDDFFPYLKYKLLSTTPARLGEIYGMAEGIEYRLKEQMERLPSTADFDQWLKAVKTKRFTYTRLSRLACALLLELTPAEVKEYNKAPYMRLLGFNAKGQQVLSRAKKTSAHQIIAKVSKDDKNAAYRVDYRAGKIYQLQNQLEQDLKRAPIRIF
ncbi:nucleotidyltransferase [Ligilactobacillus animalis]|uniref:tRNA(Met) cytidine acetate ligase n=1 Tax=Ligilactobacillus animalis TaxID=1605 RepID=A0ABR4RMZ3_9LACO|nr:nucleotidyltransferase [Ligilactobacillus animalis]KDA45473.1 cytidyltransferase-like domain protein [Ligilactobacillus animalis]MEE0261768.1 nucleotidyltransferase [Ligilactobacillus animalis]PNQ52339.1 nucleotidyltransferase [Ligilactobacillus animalis]